MSYLILRLPPTARDLRSMSEILLSSPFGRGARVSIANTSDLGNQDLNIKLTGLANSVLLDLYEIFKVQAFLSHITLNLNSSGSNDAASTSPPF